jgi:prevent-host-death family protein
MGTLAKSLPRKPLLQARPSQPKPLASVMGRSTSVAAAKANLSALLKSVEQSREEVTLLRRGVPIARIVPIVEPEPVSGYGWMRGSAHELGDIVGPSGEEWDAGDA